MSRWTWKQALATGAAVILGVTVAATGVAQDAPGVSPGDDGATIDLPADHAPDTPERQAALRKRLTFLLSGYEYFPSRSDLDEVAPATEVVPVLLDFARDGDMRPMIRVRAVDALGLYDTDTSRTYLRDIATRSTDGLPKAELRVAMSMRHHAITSLARAGEAEELEVLKNLLDDEDFQIRLTAVSAIGKHTGASGKEVLRAVRDETSNPVMLREIRKHLR